ncbi:MAG: FHA domain-containing protein [archaeon]|nr:FHA domain-containing protein [archaeon]
MNPASSTQKDNELVTNNPTIRQQKKLLTDSDDKENYVIANDNRVRDRADISFGNNNSTEKKAVRSILESKVISEENKPNHNMDPNTMSENFIVSEEYISNIKNVMDQARKLQIKIIVTSTLEKGRILEITPLGLTNSIRDKSGDGYVIFGFFTANEMKDNCPIDFLIKPKEENFEARFKGKHFQIRFEPSNLKYYICDLGNGFGTFVKLCEETVIKDNYLINLGNSYIVLIYDEDIMGSDGKNYQSKNNHHNSSCYGNNFKNEKILILKIFSGNDKFEPIYCNPGIRKKYIIGRDETCDVMMEDSLLSRFHCSVIYKEDLGWCIIDGIVTETGEQKKSTNGTWLYLMEETEINQGMIFKGNQNVFKCSFVD